MAAPFTPLAFEHPLLGQLTGRALSTTPGVTNFRSIPFASVPARFRQSVLLDHIPPNSSRDFTQYGTACPAGHPDDTVEQTGGPLPGEEPKKRDEFSCLNLTISAPREALGGKDNLLPVMVYVHGGGFSMGAGHISGYEDTSRLVELSMQEGHPILMVSIHYRVNWFGFLACQDLVDEAASFGEPHSNFGLHDQRTAFFWIKRHIAGFGGDPNSITAFGESAGSVSIAMHMCADSPLFNRAVLMSGVPATVVPLDLKYKELEYLELLKVCGIAESDPERLSKLREVPVDKLTDAVSAVGIIMFHPLKDATFFSRGSPNYWSENDLIANCPWIDAVVVGENFWEGSVLQSSLKGLEVEKFIAHTTRSLGEKLASQLYAAYEISPNMHHSLFWTRMTYLMGDLLFSEPAYKLARSLAEQQRSRTPKVYRYTMTTRNPFPGHFLHQVPGHHFVDLAFVFGKLRERYPTKRLRQLSDEMGRRWLKFGAGLEPWDQYRVGQGEEEKLLVIAGGPEFLVKSRAQDEEDSEFMDEGPRRYAAWDAIGQVMKNLAGSGKNVPEAERVRRTWGPDGGLFRLMGVKGPYGALLP